MAKPCSKRFSTLNSVLYTWFAHETSIRSLFVSVFILTHLRPIAVKKLAYTIVGGKFRENMKVSKLFYMKIASVLYTFVYTFALNSSSYTWFAHETSIRSLFVSVFILTHLRPIAVKKLAYTIVGGKFHRKYVRKYESFIEETCV